MNWSQDAVLMTVGRQRWKQYKKSKTKVITKVKGQKQLPPSQSIIFHLERVVGGEI